MQTLLNRSAAFALAALVAMSLWVPTLSMPAGAAAPGPASQLIA